MKAARLRAGGRSGGSPRTRAGICPRQLRRARVWRPGSARPAGGPAGRLEQRAGRPDRWCTARSPSRAGTAGRRGRGRGPPAELRRVERDDDRLAAACLCAAHEARDELVRGAPVELEPARRVPHRGRALLHRRATPGSRDHRHALGGGRPRDGEIAPPGAPARARRSARAGTASAAGGRTARPTRSRAADVAQHARDDPPPLERGAVRTHRRLGAGAARHVGECLGRHPLPGRAPRASRTRTAPPGTPAAPRRRGRPPSAGGSRARPDAHPATLRCLQRPPP